MTSEEKAVIEELCAEEADVTPGTVVLRAGGVYDRSMVLVDGFMLRTVRDNGKDHIVGLQVPGDFVDLHSFALKRLDHDIVAVGPCRIAYARHEDINRAVSANPHLARILWFATLLDAAIHREWIVKTKQLRADACTAHVLAELWARLELVDLARPNGFVSPLTQGHLADICGTTPVHMNRALRSLREAGICEFRRGRLFCENRQALEDFGRFDPAYLYADDTLGIREDLDKG
nr:Crp/Fnr family transcriptional regulator [Aurantiacibacter sp. 219JJ12-13]MDP5261143.1 Crp/Fnr family transcriptional regulator [Aurantiacibacter sp. 219JJ12-13]